MKKSFLIICMFLALSCTTHSPEDLAGGGDVVLNLKWNKAYPDDTMDKSAVGLQWALSYLGAKSPEQLESAGNEVIKINLNELGFSENAMEKLTKLHIVIKLSQEYQTNNAIDLGRYVSLLIGAPEHYYAITGVPAHLEDLLANYTLKPEKGYVNHSDVSLVNRNIQFSEQQNFKQVFLSAETDPVTGQIFEYETVEIIENGQLRFGIFNADGNRQNNANPEHTNAGKPAKCMWCHESNIQQLHFEQTNVSGFLTYPQLQNTLISYNQLLRDQRLALSGGVNFSQTQDHAYAELLYISFMEPSVERLSEEWQMPVDEIQALLIGLPTHIYEEYPFLGTLYRRADIEVFSPFAGLPVSSNVREQSEIEVNYIN
jgi:hypothetical protein